MTPPFRHRNVAIAGGVVVFHLAALWALQTGLLRRTVELVVPAMILSEVVPPVPQVEPPKPQPPAPPPPRPRVEPVHKPVTPRPLPPPPQPVARPNPLPAPEAPLGVATPQPPAPPIAAPVSPAPAPAPAAAPAEVDLPATDADYLQNPQPAYPPISKRLGEQGKVVVRVLIDTDGTAQRAEVAESSGFDRLDKTAVSAVLKWRFVPRKRGGVPQAMWYRVPINFVLN